MSRTKAGLVAQTAPANTVVIGADTIVVLDEPLDGDLPAGPNILGKPSGAAQAVDMLQRLRARRHRVLTAVSVVDATSQSRRDDLVTASVPCAPQRRRHWRLCGHRQPAG